MLLYLQTSHRVLPLLKTVINLSLLRDHLVELMNSRLTLDSTTSVLIVMINLIPLTLVMLSVSRKKQTELKR